MRLSLPPEDEAGACSRCQALGYKGGGIQGMAAPHLSNLLIYTIAEPPACFSRALTFQGMGNVSTILALPEVSVPGGGGPGYQGATD